VLGALAKRADAHAWQHVHGLGGAVQLAARVQDRRRKQPIVCVTVPKWSSEPIVDMDALADTIAAEAELVLLERGEPNEELEKRLPNGLGVHGGALRIWFPFEHRAARSNRHPRLTLREPGDAAGALEWTREQLERYRAERVPVPTRGEDLTAVVRRVGGDGVECVLGSGRVAHADRLHLTRVSGLPPERVLRPGQTLLVRVAEPAARPVRVSLLEHEPDLWQRIGDECQPGRVIAGRVAKLRNFGALVEVLPGALGLLPKSEISDEWVTHAEDWLRERELVAVRIVNVDADAEKVALTMRGVGERDLPAAALAVRPGGPPWLDEASALARSPDANTSESGELDAAALESPSPDAANGDENARAEGDGAKHDRALDAERRDRRSAVEEPCQQPEEGERNESAPPKAAVVMPPQERSRPRAEPTDDAAADDAAADLAAATAAADPAAADPAITAADPPGGDAAPGDLQRLLGQVRVEVSRLHRERSAAELLSRRLDEEIRAAERRIAQYADDRGLPAALSSMTRSIEALRRQLAVAERERQRALDRALKESGRADGDARTRERVEERVKLLERASPDIGEEDLFIAECMECWEAGTEPSDRTRYPWRAPALSEDFLASAESVHIGRRQIASACALVACGRIREVRGAALHELRTGKGATTPQRRRDDGATAWRCSISEGSGAVRLHYWQLPDGSVELARLGYHDDTSI
jgi:hypothetical protein